MKEEPEIKMPAPKQDSGIRNRICTYASPVGYQIGNCMLPHSICSFPKPFPSVPPRPLHIHSAEASSKPDMAVIRYPQAGTPCQSTEYLPLVGALDSLSTAAAVASFNSRMSSRIAFFTAISVSPSTRMYSFGGSLGVGFIFK